VVQKEDTSQGGEEVVVRKSPEGLFSFAPLEERVGKPTGFPWRKAANFACKIERWKTEGFQNQGGAKRRHLTKKVRNKQQKTLCRAFFVVYSDACFIYKTVVLCKLNEHSHVWRYRYGHRISCTHRTLAVGRKGYK
jgi:hypothetical protein